MGKEKINFFIIFLILLIIIMPISISNIEKNFIPELTYNPTSHNFGYLEEGQVYQTTFDIWNLGADTLTWNLEIIHTWITLSPTSGTSTGEHDTVTVTIDTTGLSQGNHSGFISISSNDGGESRYFNIDLFINNPPNTPNKFSGPTSVIEGTQYPYSTVTTDPDGDKVKYGFDFNNDGVIQSDHWTYFLPSGNTCNVLFTFYGLSIRYLRAKAEDIHGAQSDFSPPLMVTVKSGNNAPNTPSTPSGPSSGMVGYSYKFYTNSIDPDGDDIKYGWDWDGDGIVDEWTIFYSSGEIINTSHIWTEVGSYNIQIIAKDINDAASDFSNFKTIVISSNNNPPDKPKITGPSSGRTGNSYTYIVTTEDPDEDNLYYWIDWDDSTNSGWFGPFDSGLTVSKSHIWSANGTYSIKVKSKDEFGTESQWSDPLNIIMPKNKLFLTIKQHFYRLTNQFLNLKFLF